MKVNDPDSLVCWFERVTVRVSPLATADSVEFGSSQAAVNAAATAISTEVGGAFTLFGGYVTGLQIELVRDERLVQVWRAASWGPGEFSVVRFVLADAGAGTQLTFDHCGFPPGRGAVLASGWFGHYWEPLKKFLAQPSGA